MLGDSSFVNRKYAADAVAAALAAESCCAPSDFRVEGVRVFEMTPERAGNSLARRFTVLDDSLTVVSMGAGVVVAATSEWVDWVSELFGDARDADEAFSLGVLSEASRRMEKSSMRLNGPYAYNVTSEQDWVKRSAPDGYVIENRGKRVAGGAGTGGLAECGGAQADGTGPWRSGCCIGFTQE